MFLLLFHRYEDNNNNNNITENFILWANRGRKIKIKSKKKKQKTCKTFYELKPKGEIKFSPKPNDILLCISRLERCGYVV
jgi:hypothetical protein